MHPRSEEARGIERPGLWLLFPGLTGLILLALGRETDRGGQTLSDRPHTLAGRRHTPSRQWAASEPASLRRFIVEPIAHDSHGAPVYAHQVTPEPIINARDCELAGFDLTLVLEAAKAATP